MTEPFRAIIQNSSNPLGTHINRGSRRIPGDKELIEGCGILQSIVCIKFKLKEVADKGLEGMAWQIRIDLLT